jgi:hypothetical protein
MTRSTSAEGRYTSAIACFYTIEQLPALFNSNGVYKNYIINDKVAGRVRLTATTIEQLPAAVGFICSAFYRWNQESYRTSCICAASIAEP